MHAAHDVVRNARPEHLCDPGAHVSDLFAVDDAAPWPQRCLGLYLHVWEHQQGEHAHCQASRLQARTHGAVLPLDLRSNILDLVIVSLVNAVRGKRDLARFNLDEQHVTGLVDHHDVDLTVLLLQPRPSGPIDAVEQGVGV